MAKQIEDTLTPDMLGEQKKRGRPATGKAMTAAERQQKRRREATRKIWGPGADLTTASTSDLLEEMAGAVRGGYLYMAEAISAELLKRTAVAEARRRQDAGA